MGTVQAIKRRISHCAFINQQVEWEKLDALVEKTARIDESEVLHDTIPIRYIPAKIWLCFP